MIDNLKGTDYTDFCGNKIRIIRIVRARVIYKNVIILLKPVRYTCQYPLLGKSLDILS